MEPSDSILHDNSTTPALLKMLVLNVLATKCNLTIILMRNSKIVADFKYGHIQEL